MVSNPIVSIIIPTKNRSALLRRAVSSALNQDYKNIEVVVVNDGSTDDTREMLDELERSYKNLFCIHLESSKGACYARNQGITASTGEFVTNLDDDDEIAVDRVSQFLNCYDDQWSFLCSEYINLNDSEDYPTVSTNPIIKFDCIKRRNLIGNSIFVRKDRLVECGLYDEALVSWQDYDLWFRLIKDFGPAYKIPHHSYYVNARQDHQRISTSSNAYQGYLQFIRKHEAELSNMDLKSQSLNDIFNRNEQLSLVSVFTLAFDVKSASRILSYFIKQRFPEFYSALARLLVRKKAL